MDYAAQAVGVSAWFLASFALMNYLGKRQARLEVDPVSERARAEKIAKSIGGWAIWAMLGATFLVALASGIWVFVGLATGTNYFATAKMGGIFALSLPAYFFLERVMNALNR